MLYRLVVNGDKQQVDLDNNPYRDLVQDSYAYEAILYFTNKGVISGTGENSFSPDKPMTRAEFARLLSTFLPDAADGDSPSFKDTNGHWAEKDIDKLASSGLMIGFGDGSFRPDAELTRAQIVAVLLRLLGRDTTVGGNTAFTDVPATHWAYGYIQEASK